MTRLWQAILHRNQMRLLTQTIGFMFLSEVGYGQIKALFLIYLIRIQATGCILKVVMIYPLFMSIKPNLGSVLNEVIS
jgi:hypothetical protein